MPIDPPSVSRSDPAASRPSELASDPAASRPSASKSDPAAPSAGARAPRPSTYPLRLWLLVAFLGTIGVTGITSSVVGVWLIGKGISEQAQAKARLDLNSARLIYQDRLERLRTNLRFASMRVSLIHAVASGNADAVRAEALAVKNEWKFDYLTILDGSGRTLDRAQGADADGPPPSPMVSEVVAGKVDAVGTIARDATSFARESPDVAARARLVVRTRDGVAQPPHEVAVGLVLEGASAVRDGSGQVVAILQGGILLNRDNATVDQIKDTIFALEVGDGHATGGASLCLGDVRVATSIRMANGERAVGTTVDPVVRRRVLDENTSLVDRAIVLGDVYFTAYEPIRDPEGRPIGILSLGVPERKFILLRNEVLAIFIGIVLCGAAVAFVLAGVIGRRVLYPIQELAAAMRSYERGDLEVRMVQFSRTPTELVELGNGLRAMAKALRERELQLKYRAEKQLGKSERLAMIGRLSAGVAHEINNPLGGILLFSSLLLKKASSDDPSRTGLERICNEAKRCQRIVQGLLDFARPREPKREQTVLEDVVERTLQLVTGQSLFHNINVVKEYEQPKPECWVDPAQLQQVILNLVVNAAEAMDGTGTLAIVICRAEDGGAAQVEIADSGCGILPENLERLFEPFFTTKEVGRGTGLGLSISRSIIESHHGTIWAESTVGNGTRFFIRIPAQDTH
jgi:two-component system, NtrC family, sensor kinase